MPDALTFELSDTAFAELTALAKENGLRVYSKQEIQRKKL